MGKIELLGNYDDGREMHPTGDEIINKINELIMIVNRIVATKEICDADK